MNFDHNKKYGLIKFHSGYGKFNLNIPKGYSLKVINAQTASVGGNRKALYYFLVFCQQSTYQFDAVSYG